MTQDQIAAFLANGGFDPSACAVLILSTVFAVVLLWGVWAMRCAYVGWSEQQLSGRVLVMLIVRFVAMYLVLTYFLLS
jgi:integrating conjugative element protein (TIGR03758 family)